jgi:hypothetical protein
VISLGMKPSRLSENGTNGLHRLLIVDGHEDLSMGALANGRDYLSSAAAH